MRVNALKTPNLMLKTLNLILKTLNLILSLSKDEAKISCFLRRPV